MTYLMRLLGQFHYVVYRIDFLSRQLISCMNYSMQCKPCKCEHWNMLIISSITLRVLLSNYFYNWGQFCQLNLWKMSCIFSVRLFIQKLLWALN